MTKHDTAHMSLLGLQSFFLFFLAALSFNHFDLQLLNLVFERLDLGRVNAVVLQPSA
jgi:hypothetical protein